MCIDFPGNSTGVDCHFLLQGIFPNQGLNLGLPYCRQMLYHLSHQGSPITSWQIDGATVKGFIFLSSKITADGVSTHEIKRCLFLGRKAMTNLESLLKSRDITLPTKVCLVKAMVFPVVTCECESWTINKTEHRRTDVFELWCWRRCLRVPWTAWRSNQSILNILSKD